MKDYIGQDLKTLAKVILWLGIVGSIVGAIVLFSTTSKVSYGRNTETIYPYIGAGFATLIGGILVSYIVSAALHGIGAAAENSRMMLNNSEEILSILKNIGVNENVTRVESYENDSDNDSSSVSPNTVIQNTDYLPDVQDSDAVKKHIHDILNKEYSSTLSLLREWDKSCPKAAPFLTGRNIIRDAASAKEAKQAILKQYEIE